MTGFPPNENKIGTIFGVLYWLSSEAKTPVPQVMEPLDMLENPPSINATVFGHRAFSQGQKTQKMSKNWTKSLTKSRGYMIESHLRRCFNEREGHIFLITSPQDPFELVYKLAGFVYGKKVPKSAKICSEQVYKIDSSFPISY